MVIATATGIGSADFVARLGHSQGTEVALETWVTIGPVLARSPVRPLVTSARHANVSARYYENA